MITFVCVKGGDPGGGARGIIVSELWEGKYIQPIMLLIVTIHLEVLFQCLVGPLSLPVPFQMVAQGKVESHVQCFSEGSKEM